MRTSIVIAATIVTLLTSDVMFAASPSSAVDGPPTTGASVETPAYAGRGIDPTQVTATSNNPVDTVVVQGSRAEVRKQVESFVAKVTRTDGELIGRWRDSLCPIVVGLSASQNAYVRSAWAELAIANRYEPALPSIRAFVNSVGRGLLIRPIYEGLMKQGDWGRPIAKRGRIDLDERSVPPRGHPDRAGRDHDVERRVADADAPHAKRPQVHADE